MFDVLLKIITFLAVNKKDILTFHPNEMFALSSFKVETKLIVMTVQKLTHTF